MASVSVSSILIFLSIALFIFLVYKGLSPILASLAAAVIVGFAVSGGPVTAIFDTFINQAVSFASQMMLLIVIGGFLSSVLEITGITDSLSRGIIKILGEKYVPVVIYIMTGLLAFLGVVSYHFIIAPIAINMLKKSNLPRNIGLISMMTAYNAVVYCLPGNCVTPNLLPTTVLGTSIFAGFFYGIFAFSIATVLGLGYVYWMIHEAKKSGRGFENEENKALKIHSTSENTDKQTIDIPPFCNALATICILFGFNILFSALDIFTASQAVIFSQLITAFWAIITNFRRLDRKSFFVRVSAGTVNVIPLIIMLGFISGFGAVIQTTSAFEALLNLILKININPYLLTFIGTALLSACMANGTGALSIVLNALSGTLMASGADLGAVHRIATMTASTLDSLPHCSNVCVSLQVFGLRHKGEYKHIFIATVIIPLIYSGLSTLACMIFA